MWKLALIWIGAVTLFFVLWALIAKLIRRITEKESAGKPSENQQEAQSNVTANH